MSMIRAHADHRIPGKEGRHAGDTRTPASDTRAVFEVPDAYINKEKRQLRDSYCGDWWLNVDYVNH